MWSIAFCVGEWTTSTCQSYGQRFGCKWGESVFAYRAGWVLGGPNEKGVLTWA